MARQNVLTFPGLHAHHLTDDISWQFYRHWGQGYLAGEGATEYHGDHSGCLVFVGTREMTTRPIVAQARVYESPKGQVSAVYSYPHGLGLNDHYFWEIMPLGKLHADVERYDTEEEMEQRIIEILGGSNG